MLKKLFIAVSAVFGTVLIVGLAASYWLSFTLSDKNQQIALRATLPAQLNYTQNIHPEIRGKILAIVSSTQELGSTGQPTGFDLMELARAYWVFTANGFAVDIASPKGGKPFAVLDDEDMGAYDYAFVNAPETQNKIEQTLNLADIKPEDYSAFYFVGGKGAMFDFPNDANIKKIIEHAINHNKLIAAICHGPAALVNVKDQQGDWFVANKRVSAFTNSEELFLKPDARSIFPFLLQTQLEQRGAMFEGGPDYLDKVSIEPGLITAQNPWSTWHLAEAVVTQLGHTPITRPKTDEENSVDLLTLLNETSLESAEQYVASHPNLTFKTHLLLMHAVVAGMKGEILKAISIVMLTDAARRNNDLKTARAIH